MRRYLSMYLLGLVIVGARSAWQEDVQPKKSTKLGVEEGYRFHGNRSHADHFKLLQHDGVSLLVGARNYVYNVSLADLTENRHYRIEWHPTASSRDMCLVKGKSENDCQNYIRVLGRVSDEEMIVCGTNAYNPLCRRYSQQEGKLTLRKETSGKGLCPFDPNHNSTAVVSGGELYAGTVSDFSGLDPLIYREPLRTEQYDLKHLNAPSFVSSLDYGDHVYFFLRETAVEYINCGKSIFSRVGRVCKNDKGGPHRWSNRWTSFLKSRLNCSVPGHFPFYFNEIQSTSDVISGTYGHRLEEIIYGIFTTPENSILGSAVCAFRMQDILDSFTGAFKEQATLNSNWLPVPGSEVPEPRPGSCVTDSRSLPEGTLNFVKSHSLMDESVPPFYGLPILTHTSLRYKFTNIAVDPQVRSVDGKTYDIILIGTDKGKVIRAVNIESYDSASRVKPVVLEEIQVSEHEWPIKNLKVVRADRDDPRLVVVFDDEIRSIPLRRCHSETIKSCSECVALQDPSCAWNPSSGRCVPVPLTPGSSSLIQNVLTGYSDQCPDNFLTDSSSAFSEGPRVGASQSVSAIYSAETFTIAVVVSCFSALIVGFLSGLLFSRRYKLSDDSRIFRGAPHLEQRRLSRVNDASPVSEPAKMNNFIDNQLDKNNMSTLELKKVKKTYV